MNSNKQTIPSTIDVAYLKADPSYERSVATLRYAREVCVKAVALNAAAISHGDTDPERLSTHDYMIDSIAIIEAELLQWGVASS